jgi:hypothetical protein
MGGDVSIPVTYVCPYIYIAAWGSMTFIGVYPHPNFQRLELEGFHN